MATIDKLQKQLSDINARMAAIETEVDNHNGRSGWLGYITGDNIRLRSYTPHVMGAQTGEFADKGDHPEYYELSKQRNELNRQLAIAQREALRADRNAIINNDSTTHKVANVTPQNSVVAQLAQDVGQLQIPVAEPTTIDVMSGSGVPVDNTSVNIETRTSSNVGGSGLGATPQRTTPVYPATVSVPVTPGENPYGGVNYSNDNWYTISPGSVTQDAVTINPIGLRGDNGGNQHAAMNILNQRGPATFGQMLSMANFLQGKKGYSGGLNAITQTMQDADRLNAYQAQGRIAGRVQQLLGQGYGANEARYLALSEYGLDNGLDRMAVGLTMPEYVKYADERARRELDTVTSAGGNYQSRDGLGYTPLGVSQVSYNGDGTMNINQNGHTITNVPIEYGQSSVYGAIKGGGAGLSNAASRYVDTQNKAWKMGTDLENNRLQVEAMRNGDGTGLARGSNRMTYEEYERRKQLDHELALERERAKQELRNKQTAPAGNVSGLRVYSAR